MYQKAITFNHNEVVLLAKTVSEQKIIGENYITFRWQAVATSGRENSKEGPASKILTKWGFTSETPFDRN